MCINVCRVLDPQVIIFGGGLAKAGDVLLDLVRKHMKQKTWTVLPTSVQLLQAKSENGGVIGAALAAQNKFSDHKQAHNVSSHHTIDPSFYSSPASSSDSSSSSWVLPVMAASSAVVLGLTWQADRTQTSKSSNQALQYLRTGLLVSQIGLGIAMFFLRK